MCNKCSEQADCRGVCSHAHPSAKFTGSMPSSSLSDWIQRLGPAARFCWFGGVASACRLPDGLAGAAFGAWHVRIDLNLPFTPRT